MGAKDYQGFRPPDGNIVEIGESMPGFARRLFRSGMSAAAEAEKTGIRRETVEAYLYE
jgi:hypothetical protein